MIYGPCGARNPESPCMQNGKCTKKYPRELIRETVHSDKGYPLYRRKEPADGGKQVDIRTRRGEIEIFDNSWVDKILSPPKTTLTAFFHLCQNDTFVRTLLYSEVPRYYTWNTSKKEWHRRIQGTPVENQPGVKASDALGRVYTVHVTNLECFCLRMLLHHLDNDFIALQHQVAELVPQLLPEQNHVFLQVLHTIDSGNGGLFFLGAPGGTGKTFLLKLLLMSVRKGKRIAVSVASSGIAATLLIGGRTAHSVLKLPLNLAQEDSPICNFSKNSSRGKMLRECKLLVWDESTMSHKKAIEALNRTLQDLRDSKDIMGGMVVLLAGDFRQTLPVIQRGRLADEIQACIKSSNLWSRVEKLSLKTNMRVHLHNDVDSFGNLFRNVFENR
ncbi:ATP-dependent DNA helicase [Trichonephila clavipes]|nr:ATP-dependent DNA helicase [Trichonephila clavipes]